MVVLADGWSTREGRRRVPVGKAAGALILLAAGAGWYA